MRVKRYVVDSMPDALQKIRTDLGKDAVILNTKEIRTGGFLGFFAKKKIEVIAATDNSSTPSPQSSPLSNPNLAAASTLPNKQKLAASKAAYAQAGGAGKTPNQVALLEDKSELQSNAFQEAIKAALEKPAARLESAPAAPEQPPVIPTYTPPPAAPTPAVKPKEDAMLEELKQMKEMMTKLSIKQKESEPVPESLERMKQQLLNQEIEPEYIEQLLASCCEAAAENQLPELSDGFVYGHVRSELEQLLGGKRPKAISPGCKVAHFVGPTGVGKTTTIAKLAAEQVLKYHRKVGFITSDTYRIAAVEQLKTYATILNVPLEVVFSPQDLAKAFDKLQDCDIIFMDTAGRNFRNEMYVSELNSLLQTRGVSETFLVLSLTAKYKDMKTITSNFTKFKLDKVLFTKMDETESYGAIVNIVKDFGLGLSFVTNGQSVPDDIMEANEKHIIDLILGDNGNG